MALFLFFAFALVLVILAAILGVAAAVHILFPRFAFYMEPKAREGALDEQTAAALFFLRFCLAIFVAVGVPIVGGLAYAVSGSSWFVEFLGEPGRYFWVWVAAAFATGVAVGSFLATGNGVPTKS